MSMRPMRPSAPAIAIRIMSPLAQWFSGASARRRYARIHGPRLVGIEYGPGCLTFGGFGLGVGLAGLCVAFIRCGWCGLDAVGIDRAGFRRWSRRFVSRKSVVVGLVGIGFDGGCTGIGFFVGLPVRLFIAVPANQGVAFEPDGELALFFLAV